MGKYHSFYTGKHQISQLLIVFEIEHICDSQKVLGGMNNGSGHCVVTAKCPSTTSATISKVSKHALATTANQAIQLTSYSANQLAQAEKVGSWRKDSPKASNAFAALSQLPRTF